MHITCEGFELRIITEAEYAAYFELLSENKDRLKHYFPKTIQAVQNLEQAKNHLKKIRGQHNNNELYPFGMYTNEKLIGWVSIKNIDWRIPKAELGYYIDASHEGKGIASKGVKAIIQFAFEKLEMEKLYIRTGHDNLGSKQIALKNGFKQEGILKNEFKLATGELADILYFGKLRGDKNE